MMGCQGRGFFPWPPSECCGAACGYPEGEGEKRSPPQAGYLLAQDAHLLGCQVVHCEGEAPVEAALPSEGVVMDVRRLPVLLKPE